MSASAGNKTDFWATFTNNKLLLTLTITYIITGSVAYYFYGLPWTHKDSGNENTPEEAIREEVERWKKESGIKVYVRHDKSGKKDKTEGEMDEEYETIKEKASKKAEQAKNLLYKNKVFVYIILGWLGFISLILAWLSKIVVGPLGKDGEPRKIIDALPHQYFGTLLKLVFFMTIILGLIGLTFYLISYTPLTLTIIIEVINFLIIGGGLTIIFESTGKSAAALLGASLGALLGGLMGGFGGALIAMIIGGLIGNILGIGEGKGTGPRKSFIKALLAYIPCFFVTIVDYIKHEFNLTTSKIWILLLVEILIIGLRVLLPIIYAEFNKLTMPKGNILIKDPVYLNNLNSLGMFLSAQQAKDGNFHERQIFNYNYALSFWLWINPQPASTSPAYTRSTSIIDFADILKINFNRNKIEIYAATSKKSVTPEQLIRVYEWKNIQYQRWNNFVVNYSGGTLDIFINNVLVSSTPSITPITQFEKATAGSVNGIYGGIKNIVYYEQTLTRRQINIVSKE